MITAMRPASSGRKSVVVGDRVALVGDIAGGPDSLARVVRVEPRQSMLRRSADDTDPVERVIVANADQLVVVTALADPEPRPRLVDRCLVAAYDAGLDPLLVLTKADLVEPDAVPRRRTPPSTSPTWSPAATDDAEADIVGIDEVREQLAGRVTVLVGHSGVGKSTLVNALVPDTDRAIGGVNIVTGRGRHTSTSRWRCGCPARRLGHRHAGHPVVRTRPRRTGADHQPSSPTSNPGPPSARAAARTTSRSAGSTRSSPPARAGPGGRLTARLAAPAAARASRHGRVSGRVNRPP